MRKNWLKVALLSAMFAAVTFTGCDKKEPSTAVAETGTTVTDVDGNTYRTKVYNGVEWMIDNSKKTTGVTGCTYNPIDRTNVSGVDYGRLYSWNCAPTACPEGWCLPSDADFKALFTALGTDTTAWADWNSGSSLVGYYNGSYFGSQGMNGLWWSSSRSNWHWSVIGGTTSGELTTNNSNSSYSVRCRKTE
jgi:uncharacterized protein (TIGR02145 family)